MSRENTNRPTGLGAAMLSYVCTILLGSFVIIINATLVPISETYAVSLPRAGLLISCLGIGRILSQGAGGMLTDRLGRKIIFLLGQCIMLVFFLSLPFSRSFPLSVALCIFAGVGYGMLNTSSMAVIFDAFAPSGRNAIAQSGVQLMFATGGILTPLIANILLSRNVYWGNLYWFWAAYTVVMIVITILMKFPPPFKRKAIESGFQIEPKLTKDGILLCLVLFCVYSCGIASTTWLPTLATKSLGFEATQSVLLLSIYNVGCVAGTLVFMQLLKKRHGLIFLIVNPIIAISGLALCIFTRNSAVFMAGAFLAGSVIPVYFNLCIGLGGELFGTRAGTITGMIATSSSISTLAIPALTGWILEKSSVNIALSTGFGFGIAAIALSLALKARYNKLKGI